MTDAEWKDCFNKCQEELQHLKREELIKKIFDHPKNIYGDELHNSSYTLDSLRKNYCAMVCEN